MKKLNITCELICTDLAESSNFYKNILGFSIIEKTKSWLNLSFGKSNLMFITQGEIGKDISELKNKNIGASMVLLIELTDIERYFTKIQKSVEVVKPLHKTSYGTVEFVIKDNNGYYLMFCQRNNEN